jgi:hypothetical protein
MARFQKEANNLKQQEKANRIIITAHKFIVVFKIVVLE